MADIASEISHEDVCRGYYQQAELEIQVGETQTIIPQQRTHCACAYLFNLVDGELVLVAFPEESGGFASRRSSDGGHTWRDAPTWPT